MLEDRLHLLLIQMTKVPYTGMWALPGGRIQDDESLDAAAVRILCEETGMANATSSNCMPWGSRIGTRQGAWFPSPILP